MEDIPATIIAMEKAALTRWGSGDPSGFLEISAEEVVYFDPYVPRRIDGLAALTECYRPIWGKIFFERFELLNPVVQVAGDMAVLTFNYVSYKGDQSDRWNCTEVYRRSGDGRWQIIQSHWSYTEVFKSGLSLGGGLAPE